MINSRSYEHEWMNSQETRVGWSQPQTTKS